VRSPGESAGRREWERAGDRLPSSIVAAPPSSSDSTGGSPPCPAGSDPRRGRWPRCGSQTRSGWKGTWIEEKLAKLAATTGKLRRLMDDGQAVEQAVEKEPLTPSVRGASGKRIPIVPLLPRRMLRSPLVQNLSRLRLVSPSAAQSLLLESPLDHPRGHRRPAPAESRIPGRKRRG
jgi:hypothetical protein